MDLPDINLLVYAFRPEMEHHEQAKHWLEKTLNSGRSLRLFSSVEAGFLRIVTHPRIFDPPSPSSEAITFLQALCQSPHVEIVHWTPAVRNRWTTLCRELNLAGNDCNDAMLAALAMERSLRLVTFDQGFSRFSGLSSLILN